MLHKPGTIYVEDDQDAYGMQMLETAAVVDDKAVTKPGITMVSDRTITRVDASSRTGVHEGSITKEILLPTVVQEHPTREMPTAIYIGQRTKRSVAKTLAMTVIDDKEQERRSAEFILRDICLLQDERAKNTLFGWYQEFDSRPTDENRRALLHLAMTVTSPVHEDRKALNRLRTKAIFWCQD